MICGDCKGSGKYIGFAVFENCSACAGTGESMAGNPGDDIVLVGNALVRSRESFSRVRFNFPRLRPESATVAAAPDCYWFIYLLDEPRTLPQGTIYFDWDAADLGYHGAKQNFLRGPFYALYQREEKGYDIFRLCMTK